MQHFQTTGCSCLQIALSWRHHVKLAMNFSCWMFLSLVQYAFNIFLHNAPVLENGYNEEEMKMVKETRKIWVSVCLISLNSGQLLWSLHYSLPNFSLVVIVWVAFWLLSSSITRTTRMWKLLRPAYGFLWCVRTLKVSIYSLKSHLMRLVSACYVPAGIKKNIVCSSMFIGIVLFSLSFFALSGLFLGTIYLSSR